jgi:hypothetical protein
LSQCDIGQIMHGGWLLMLLPFFGIITPAPETPSEACELEIQKMNVQIAQLRRQRDQHLDLARQYQTQGDQWQYNTGRIDDAYDWWGKANAERRKAFDIQTQIDQMLERINRIIQFYPELYQP